MDIISMQIANKVLKRMNTEFNGAYDIFIATEGQKTFSTTRPHDISGHTLHVYVNGYHAVCGEDYTHANNTTFEFKNSLRKGDVVLATTQIVGIPRFEVINPEYDDTSIKTEIGIINNQISNIISALDENGDGSIVNTIADIKKQWADADSNIMLLVEQKATTEDLQLLATRVEELAGLIPAEYDDTELANKIATLESTALHVNQKIEVIEKKIQEDSVFLIDDLTGRKHKLSLTNGILGANAIGEPLEITHTAPLESTVNIPAEFKLNIIANADLNQKVKLMVSKPEQVSIEQNDKVSWNTFGNQTVEALTNLSYNLRATASEEGTHEISIAILKYDNNHELGKVTFSIEAKEPPFSLVTGTVHLNEADHNNILISLQKVDSEEESVSVGILEDGEYAIKVSEAGNYNVSIINSTNTHRVVGLSGYQITVELGTNVSKDFTLERIDDPVIEPTEDDFITWDEEIFTVIPKGEDGNPPYQLMQINYNRLQEVDACRLDIVDANTEKTYHTTSGVTTVNEDAMFQWSYRDLSELTPEGDNLDELERTNETLLPEGTNLTISITVTKDEKEYSIITSYTITEEDVLNATFEDGGIE